MSLEKDASKMPVWQNHERRLTTLENAMDGISTKMDKVETTIKEGNSEQKEMLSEINRKMVNEFFGKRKSEHETKLKIYLGISAGVAGSGGIIYMLIDLFVKNVGG